MTLHCRVTRINMERLQLDLTCRSSDLADKEGKFRYATGINCFITSEICLKNVLTLFVEREFCVPIHNHLFRLHMRETCVNY